MFCLSDIYNRLSPAWFDTKDALIAEIEALKQEGYSMNEFEVYVPYSIEKFLSLS